VDSCFTYDGYSTIGYFQNKLELQKVKVENPLANSEGNATMHSVKSLACKGDGGIGGT
jgi:hypothetical protein